MIILHQRKYVEEILERFQMRDCNPIKTPMGKDHDLTKPMDFSEGEEEEMQNVPYAQLIGCLMYIMTCTRPDIAYPLGVLSCYMADGAYQQRHWVAAKRVLRYLKETSSHGVCLGGNAPLQLEAWVDASWADDRTERRSTGGFMTSLGGGSISWQSKRSK